MIQRGYDRRHRNLWSATRWQTYNLMCAFAGSKALSEAGINSAKDLLSFPWDTEHNDLPTEDEIAQAVAEMEAINAQRPLHTTNEGNLPAHDGSPVVSSSTTPVASATGQQESSEP